MKGPPVWAVKLLHWLADPRTREETEGDLLEMYHYWTASSGGRQADWRYIMNVVKLLRPFAKEKRSEDYSTTFLFSPVMIRNYFKIAFRNLAKNKGFAAINIAGLSLGMICCLFIFLWVQDERNVDTFHENSPQLYSVYQTITSNGKVEGNYASPLKVVEGSYIPRFLMEEAKAAVPEIERQVYYATGYELPWGHPETFQVGDKKVKLEGSRASSDFFKMFSYPIIQGNAETALRDVSGIAISRKMAELFFGSPEKAMGKTMRYEDKLNFVVCAVFENIPSQSAMKFDFLFNWEAQKTRLEWASNDFRAFVQLSKKADVTKVETKINRFLATHFNENKAVKTEIGLQPFADQYLHGVFVNGKPEGGRIEYVRIFSGVAIFILIIACINFMNLSTAQSVKRAKEVGLRKVVGSTRSMLAGQFFGESLLYSFFAIFLAVALLLLLLPVFNDFTGKRIASPLSDTSFISFLFLLVLITGLLAGSYPALYLSSLKPVRVLKGVISFTSGALLFRRGLTVFQFVLSIVLLIATIVISRQTSFVRNAHLGYDQQNLLYVRIEGELMKKSNYLLFKERASALPGIDIIDRSTEAPHEMSFSVAEAINWEGKEKNASVGFNPASVGLDFIKLMKLEIASGRGFSRENSTDSTDAFMVNEEAVKQMGLKNPIGKWISAWKKKGHIIGVLKDYHIQSMHAPIRPLIVDVKENEYFGVIIIRTKPGKSEEALAGLGDVYRDINTNYPFSYQFLDQEFDKIYRSEALVSKLSSVFAPLAIVISCLGLLGLVLFASEQRTKEIGIRKVLGASVASVIALLSGDFLKLVMLAIVIASPVAWYLMEKWLSNFAYKIEIEWWFFALAGVLAAGNALLIVSYQSVRAALADPVKSLRTE